MSFKDRSGITIITLGDLLPGESFEEDLPEGHSLKPVLERPVGKRFPDTGKAVEGAHNGICRIRHWVVLDCGEKGQRFRPTDHKWAPAMPRDHRYVAVGVAEDQDVTDVELEERGTALPGRYTSFDEAVEACGDLNDACRVMEE